jgi:hypothetical protein
MNGPSGDTVRGFAGVPSVHFQRVGLKGGSGNGGNSRRGLFGTGNRKIKLSVAKVSAAKVSALKVRALKVSPAKVSTLKASAAKVSTLKVSPAKVSPAKVSAFETGIGLEGLQRSQPQL